MKRILVFIILFLIGLGLFFWVIKWTGWKEIKEILFTFSYWKGMVVLGLTLLIWLAGIWKWKFVLKSQGCNFSTIGLGEILFASFAVSYLFPTGFFGGEAFRMYALRKKFSLSWEKNLTTTAIEKLLSISTILLFLIFGVFSFLFLAGPISRNFGIIALIFVGGLIVGLTIFYFKSFKKESIFRWFLKFFGIKNKKNNHSIQNFEQKIFRFFDFRKSSMWKGLGIAFSKNLLILIRCWFLLFFLKGETNILIALAILFFIHLSYIFPFPAKVGSSEIAQVFVFGSLGLGTAAGITFSFILRGAEILIALLGFVFLLKLGIKFFIGGVENKINKIG